MISAEIKSKITDAGALAEVEKVESLLFDVTEESKKWKTQSRQANSLIEKIKKLGLDPEGDVDEQLEQMFAKETTKKNLKPASEMETLSKQLSKLTSELTTWKETAAKAEKEAMLEKCRTAFGSKLPDHFGKSSSLVLDNAILKGLVTVEKGIPGVTVDDEFFPIESEKGKLSGIDALKKVYSDHVIVKQKSGGSDVHTQITMGAGKEQISRSDFEQLAPVAKISYMKEVGSFSEAQ
jgi:hypothetical protein